jgi:tetratricopeptide (TPR) repeat protein
MRNSFAFALAAIVACGGSSPGPQSPTGGGSGSTTKPGAPGDDMLEVKADIKGGSFEPDALGYPGIPRVQLKPATGAALDAQIKKQREAIAKAKDLILKEAEVAKLTTMLYNKAGDLTGDAKKAVYADARQAVRDVAAIAGDKVDEFTLRQLGSYELMFDEYAAAAKAWAALVALAPSVKAQCNSKSPPLACAVDTNRAWLAFCHLRAYQNDDALAAVKDAAPSDKEPELAYVTAWAKYRKGDGAGAWQALLAASKGWGQLGNRDVLDRELVVFAARTPTTVAEAMAKLGPIFGAGNAFVLAKRLGEQYGLAGRWTDAIAAFEKAIGASAPVDAVPSIRYVQAQDTVPLDNPVEAARLGKAAIEALPKCGTKCTPKDMETLVEAVYQIGFLFHVLYASAHDDRYYQPALDLYELTTPKMTMASQEKRDESVKNMNTLKLTFKTMKAGVGNHDPKYIGNLLQSHNQEVQLCYEAQLAGNPKLGGALTVDLESDETGVIKGASTDPKAGMAELSAVAGCVQERVKSWKLPTKAKKGSTRIKIVYTLAKRTKP